MRDRRAKRGTQRQAVESTTQVVELEQRIAARNSLRQVGAWQR